MFEQQKRFWSDDFDADLLSVFPDVADILGGTIDVPVWTISHATYGRLNCPAQWNIPFGCFLWLKPPNLPRDNNGWINIGGCVTDEQEMSGTWLEWLRDAWVHGQSWTLRTDGTTFSGVDYSRCFYPIMANKRNWDGYENVEKPLKIARLWLTKANRRFARAVERYRLGKEDFPYFAVKSAERQ